jgi:hypothetical protein
LKGGSRSCMSALLLRHNGDGELSTMPGPLWRSLANPKKCQKNITITS